MHRVGMKCFWSLIIGLFLVSSIGVSSALAVPASPELFEAGQPDGAKFKARKMGDEFQNWTEDTDGYTVMKNNANGRWEFADKLKDGSLAPSGVPAGMGITPPGWIKRGLKPPRDNARAKTFEQMLIDQRSSAAPSGPEKASSGTGQTKTAGAPPQFAPGDWNPAPVSGTKKLLFIMVGFNGASYAPQALVTTGAGWNNAIFSSTPGVKSVKNFYTDNSFGQLSVTPVTDTEATTPNGIVSVSIAADHPYYTLLNTTPCDLTCEHNIEMALINAALAAAAPYVDFPALDTNADGTFTNDELLVYFIVAGYDESGSAKTPSVWAHAWGTWSSGQVAVEGKNLDRWALNGELNDSDVQHPMGVIAHELGHQMCGLPDLYDTEQINQGMGIFSLMASGSWGAAWTDSYYGTTPVSLDAWSRTYLGWSSPYIGLGTNNGRVFPPALSAATAPAKMVNPSVSETQYFLIENRYSQGWDLGMEPWLGPAWGGGLLIQHIDTTIGTAGSNDINAYVPGSHQGVMAEEASIINGSLLDASYGDVTHLFWSGTGGNTSFTNATAPNSKLYNGTATNLSVSGISVKQQNMTANLSNPATALLTPKTATYDANGGGGSITVKSYSSWTAVSNSATWLKVTAGASCTGDGTVSYTVDPYAGGTQRQGTITIASQTVTITQTPPSFDYCGTPKVISSLPYTDTASTTTATQHASDPAPSCAPPNYNTVWYTYTPPDSRTVVIDTFGSNYDTVLSVYTGPCGSLSPVVCNDDNTVSVLQSLVQLTATGGTTYHIMAGSYGAGGGTTSKLNVALVAHCTNGIQDSGETNVDCGGADCPACPDSTVPVSSITLPADGLQMPSALGYYSITGTASDNAGGSGVMTVYVSTNGGSNWNAATGTTSWSYNWTSPPDGCWNIRSKAVDNSLNAETPKAGVTVSVGNASMVSLTPTVTPSGVAQVGKTITWHAVASGSCGQYEFRYNLQPQGGSWSITQNWSSSTDWAWSPVTAGSYYIKCEVRKLGASSAEGSITTSLCQVDPTPDTIPPSSAITAPANAAMLASGLASYNVTGTASDTGGSGLSLVEVSTDGGVTWHSATGTASWSYTWTSPPDGCINIRSRATDVSLNVETPGAGVTVSVGNASMVSLTSTVVPSGPVQIGKTITWHIVATGACGLYQYRYYIQPEGGSWAMTQNWSSNPDFAWMPVTAGKYTIQGQVRKLGGLSVEGFIKSALITVFDPNAPAVLGSLTRSLNSPQEKNTTITWTGTASAGSGNFQYRFWTYNGTWSMKQNWSSSNTWNWTPTTFGLYQVSCEVRNVGVTAPQSFIKSDQFFITDSSLAPVDMTLLAPSVSAPVAPGTSVTWTATATGGTGNLEYRFWVYDTAWHMVRNWSGVNTYGWTPIVARKYQIMAQVRNVGMNVTCEDYIKSPLYEVGVSYPPAVLNSLTPVAPGAATVGVAYALTGTASGGSGSYQFRFWLKNKAVGTWSVAQNWSAAGTYNWTPGASGEYQVMCQVRNSGTTTIDGTITSGLYIVP